MAAPERLRREGLYPVEGYSPNTVRAKWDGGDKRPPKRGEYFLSGAVIEAYRAPNDLTTPYRIAKLYRVQKIERWVELDTIEEGNKA